MFVNLLTRRLKINNLTHMETIMYQARFASTKARSMRSKYYTKNDAPPHRIGVTKSWDSKHTGGIEGSLWAHERFIDDVMIRKFIEGGKRLWMLSSAPSKIHSYWICQRSPDPSKVGLPCLEVGQSCDNGKGPYCLSKWKKYSLIFRFDKDNPI